MRFVFPSRLSVRFPFRNAEDVFLFFPIFYPGIASFSVSFFRRFHPERVGAHRSQRIEMGRPWRKTSYVMRWDPTFHTRGERTKRCSNASACKVGRRGRSQDPSVEKTDETSRKSSLGFSWNGRDPSARWRRSDLETGEGIRRHERKVETSRNDPWRRIPPPPSHGKATIRNVERKAR